MSQIDVAVIEKIIGEIDELLGMRRGFNDAYRVWRERAMGELEQVIGKEQVEQLESLGPRQAPINRQHRVHIYRQRLHAQRKFLVELTEAGA